MTGAHLIGLAINGSMFLIVLALGLGASLRDATYLLRRPDLLIRSLLAMNVIMLCVSLLLIVLFNPAPEVKVALVAIALSPVPPILPGKQLKAGGSLEYTMGLLAAASVASLVLVPAGMAILGAVFDLPLAVRLPDIAGVVLISIVLPLVIGMVVNRFWPKFAATVAHPLSLVASILLLVAIIPVLLVAWPEIVHLTGNGLIVGLAAFTLIGLAVGHWLGGPDAGDRAVLAFATSARHPGVAITIASLNFPELKGVLVVVLFHLVVSTVLSVPYMRWRTREMGHLHPVVK